MKMTPSTFCLHLFIFFSEQLGRQLFIQLDIQFYLIYDMFLWTLCGPCSSNFLCDRKGQSAAEPSFPIVNINITSLAEGGRSWSLFWSLLMFYLLHKQKWSWLLNKAKHPPPFFFFSFKKGVLSLLFSQLSSQLSTLIKTWSTCTHSWTSAFSLDWRWVPIDSCSPLAPDQWAAEPST